MTCTCAPLYDMRGPTGDLDWREDCSEHGRKSAWYNSEEQVASRGKRYLDLVRLQRRARDARRKGNDS